MFIHLKNLRFYAYHGLHAGEEILGGEYEVNLTVSYTPYDAIVRDIEQTVDYTELYNIIKDKMAQRYQLLETFASETASEIIAKFPMVETVEISIFKLHPPIESFQGSVGVTYKLNR